MKHVSHTVTITVFLYQRHVTPESPAAPVTQLESPPLSHIIELDFFIVSAQM